MNLRLKHIILSGLLLWGVGVSFAQTPEELKVNADQLFEQKSFVEAGKLYLRLISDNQNARDHDLNFRYGTCLIFNEGIDKSKAITHLGYAIKNPSIDVRAYYYLGKAYHLNYQFNNALTYYNKFNDKADPSLKEEYQIENEIKSCINGKRLLTNMTDMVVLEKREVPAEDFYELYKLNEIGGTILVTDQFQTKYDKKMGHRPVIHFPANSPYIYYSSYGKDGKTGLDIYVIKRLPNNEWSLPQKLPSQINTVEDEDYPYMSADGRYLYFSSKGHNTMGGYDVFRSEYLVDENDYSAPENMDFAISSPHDDILYMVDKDDRMAYFSSARESEDGKLYVYHVRVEKIPMQLAVVKGNFENVILPSNKVIEIEVSDFSSGAIIGTFKSKVKNGNFLLTFPKSGKYNFVMTVEGEPVSHQSTITIPYLKEFRPLKMKISHLNDDQGQAYLKVDQLFDESFEDPVAVLAEVYQEISKLQPNANEFDLDSLDRIRELDQIFVQNGLDPYITKTELEHQLETKSLALEKQIAQEKEQSNIAYHLAKQNQTQANAEFEKANALKLQADNETDPVKQNELYKEAKNHYENAQDFQEQANHQLQLGEQLDASSSQKQKDLNQIQAVENQMASVSDGDKLALSNVVSDNTTFFQSTQIDANQTDFETEWEKNQNQLEIEHHELNQKVSELDHQITVIKNQNKQLESQLANTKKSKDKEAIQAQIKSNQEDIDFITEEFNKQKAALDENTEQLNQSKAILASYKNNQETTYQNDTYTSTISTSEKNQIKQSVQLTDSTNDLAEVNEKIETYETPNLNQVKVLTNFNELNRQQSPQEYLADLNQEINAQKKAKNQSNNNSEKEAIQTEINRLEALKSDKENEWKEELAQENSSNQTTDNQSENTNSTNESNQTNEQTQTNFNELSATEQKDQLITETTPEYSEKVDLIQNSSMSSAEKEEMIQLLNENTLANTQEKIQEIEAQLNADPENETLNEKLNALTNLAIDLEENPNQTAVSTRSNTNWDEVKAKVSTTDLLPTYDDQKEFIQNSDYSEAEKLKEEMALNDLVLNQIKNEKIAIQNELNNGSENEKNLNKRLNSLEKLEKEIILENKEKQTQLQAVEQATPTNELAIQSENEVKEVMSDYNSQKNDIQNSKAEEHIKLEQQIALNQSTINQIEAQINELTPYAEEAEVQQQIDKLNELKAGLEADTNNNQQKLNDLDLTVENENNTLAQEWQSDYESEKSRIENTKQSEDLKIQQKIALIDSTLANVNQQLDDLKVNETEYLSEIKALENLKSNLEAEKENNELALKQLDEMVKTSPESVVNEDYIQSTDLDENQSEIVENKTEEIKTYSDEINALKIEKSQADSEKAIKKIDKKINKLDEKKTEAEVEVMEVVTEEKQAQTNDQINQTDNKIKDLQPTLNNETSLNQIDAYQTQAKQKSEEANALIEQAKLTKDEDEAHDIYQKAIELQQEVDSLNQLVENEINVQEVTAKMNENSLDVPTLNHEKSDYLDQKANELFIQAMEHETRAQALSDSSKTVKRKYRQAVLTQSENELAKANELRLKAEELKTQAQMEREKENETLAALPQNPNVTVEGNKKDEVLNSDTYQSYYNQKLQADNQMEQVEALDEEIEALEEKKQRIIRQAVVTGGQVNEVSQDDELLALQKEIDSLKAEREKYRQKAIQSYDLADKNLAETNKTKTEQNEIVSVAFMGDFPVDEEETIIDPTAADFTPPTELKTNIFRTTDQAVYEDLTDIPVNQKQPEGLVYKVQIGAFRSQPQKTYFDNFAPVSGQKLDNGITRYMVGYFTTYTPANSTKNEIRGMGDYTDAFVVAYLNGERISLTKARQLESEMGLKDQVIDNQIQIVAQDQTPNTNQTTSATNENQAAVEINEGGHVSVNPKNEEEQNKTAYYTQTEGAVKANQVEIMPGLFFTVQIGVYSKPVPLSALFDVQPLNSQLTESQKIRYTTGVYSQIDEAVARKNEVKEKGISDAFVTAYYNGERIPISKAKDILAEQGEGVLFLNQIQDKTAVKSTQPTTNQSVEQYISYQFSVLTYSGDLPSKYASLLFNSEGLVFESLKINAVQSILVTPKRHSMAELKSDYQAIKKMGVDTSAVLLSTFGYQWITFEDSQNYLDSLINKDELKLNQYESISPEFLDFEPNQVYFRVQLAEFEGETPKTFERQLNQIDRNEVNQEMNQNGATVYRTPAYDTYEQAKKTEEKYKQLGFESVEIKAYYKTKEIKIEQAKALKR